LFRLQSLALGIFLALSILNLDKAFKKIEFQYKEFGESSINFQMRFWVEAKKNLTLLEAKSEAIILLKEVFEKNGISIPYPIRTIVNS